MRQQKIKTTVTGGIFKDENSWWHYYFGKTPAVSGNFHTEKQAREVLKAHFDEAIAQFGDRYEVIVEEKDLPARSGTSA